MKKYTRIFMLTLLLAAWLGLSAWADGAMVSVSDAQVDAGGTVTVQLSLENNPGVAGVAITLDYDASKLRPVSFDITREASSKFMLSLANEDAGTVMLVAMKDVSYSGVIAELEFEALSDAVGDAVIGFADVQLCNFNDEVVSCGSAGGVVQIANDNVPAGEEATESATPESDTPAGEETKDETSSAKTDNSSRQTDAAAQTESGDDSEWVQESIARFEQEQAVLAGESGTVSAAADEDAAAAESENSPAETDAAANDTVKPATKPAAKRSMVLIVVVVLAVVLLAVGVIAMLRMRKKDKTARH